MRILSIETSCDETAVSVLEAKGGVGDAVFTVLGNALYSQAALHSPYGGVYPNLAKREHGRNLVPLLKQALTDAHLYCEETMLIPPHLTIELTELLKREEVLLPMLMKFLSQAKKPAIDAIVVTEGPGLEPALWVGINFAKALSTAWNLPLIPSNHLEGHLTASLMNMERSAYAMKPIEFPLVGLLISGGHTELVLAQEWMRFEAIGSTRDDAIGEAFDKVARILDLPYPGGVHISRLAHSARRNAYRVVPGRKPFEVTFPRPMLQTPDLDFSFSGLKTAVLYFVRSQPELDEYQKGQIALEFENAVTDVLVEKTRRALSLHNAKSLVVGGGVAANEHIRKHLTHLVQEQFPHTALFLPPQELSTDNAIMIGMAGYFKAHEIDDVSLLKARGNLKFG